VESVLYHARWEEGVAVSLATDTDTLRRLPPRLVPVGRLDSATTGLLLVTNDGQWAQRVAHPSQGITKEYIVTSTAPVTRRALKGTYASVHLLASVFLSCPYPSSRDGVRYATLRPTATCSRSPSHNGVLLRVSLHQKGASRSPANGWGGRLPGGRADVEAGTEVEGKHVKPLEVELLLDNNSSNASRCRVKVVVNEGRHHEVFMPALHVFCTSCVGLVRDVWAVQLRRL